MKTLRLAGCAWCVMVWGAGIHGVEASSVDTWFEGFDTYGNAAAVTAAWPDDASDDGVQAPSSVWEYAGAACLQLTYTVSNKPSGAFMDRVVHTFESDQDWSAFDTFTFYYRGETGNSRDQVYFELRDGFGGTLGKASLPNDSTKKTAWTLASIDVSSFANMTNSTSLANVRSVVLGVTAGSDYGSGTVYFDNLGGTKAAEK